MSVDFYFKGLYIILYHEKFTLYIGLMILKYDFTHREIKLYSFFQKVILLYYTK